MSITVGWDLDGVHYKFGQSVWETLCQLGSTSGPCPDINSWTFYSEPEWGNLTDKEFVDVCHKGADMGIVFSHGGYDLDSIVEMNKLFFAGYKTVIVTDRSFGSTPKVSEDRTVEELDRHGARYDDIYFTADKAAVPLDYMIDDKVENFTSLQDAGVECYLIDRPWNQHVKAGDYRLSSVKEYTDIILKETAFDLPVYGSGF